MPKKPRRQGRGPQRARLWHDGVIQARGPQRARLWHDGVIQARGSPASGSFVRWGGRPLSGPPVAHLRDGAETCRVRQNASAAFPATVPSYPQPLRICLHPDSKIPTLRTGKALFATIAHRAFLLAAPGSGRGLARSLKTGARTRRAEPSRQPPGGNPSGCC
jgi:hypothetical protein